MKKALIIIIALVLLAGAFFFFLQKLTNQTPRSPGEVGQGIPISFQQVQKDPQIKAVIDSSKKIDNNLEVTFHHNSSKVEPVSILGAIQYKLSKTQAKGGEKITLTVYNWSTEYFEIKIGANSDQFAFGKKAESLDNDQPVLKELQRQGINKADVVLEEDYAPRGHSSPYSKTYRDTKSGKRIMVSQGLPMVTEDGAPIDVGWQAQGNKFVEKNNLFKAAVDGTSVELTVKNDQPDGRKKNDKVSYRIQLFLNGVEQTAAGPTLLPVDPTNPNYQNNVLEWDYGIAKRRLRIIEGSVLGSWVFNSNPNGDVKIIYNQSGNFLIRLNKYSTDRNTIVIPASEFTSAVYPFEVGDSSSQPPDKTKHYSPSTAKDNSDGSFDISLSGETVEVGDKGNNNSFSPRVKLNRWDGENYLDVRYLGKTFSKKANLNNGKISVSDTDIGTEIYPLDNKTSELGGIEFNIVLNKKPNKNSFIFDLDYGNNLEFYYQPALTPEEIARGMKRPENVVGSYAVYSTNKRNHFSGENNYATGKLFHIYRPQVSDAAGHTTWATMDIKNKKLTITVDQAWLDNAVYPVVVDPTLGYTSAGASWDYGWGNTIVATGDTYSGEANGLGIGMYVYSKLNTAGSYNIQLGIYNGTSLLTSSPTASIGLSSTTAAWYSSASNPALAAVNYTMAWNADSNQVQVAYDTASSVSKYVAQTFGTWPSSVTWVNTATAYKHSIYLNYVVISSPATFNPDHHPEVTSVDGTVTRQADAQIWADLQGGAGTTIDDNNSGDTSWGYMCSYTSTDQWHILLRGIILFDTGGLPDNATVSAATLSIRGSFKYDQAGWAPDINIYSSNPTSDTALAAGDFVYTKFGTTAFADTAITYAGWSTTDYNDFALNVSGIAAISKTGVSKFGVRNANYDVANTAPTPWLNYKSTQLIGKQSEAGAGYKPELVVTYTIPLPTLTGISLVRSSLAPSSTQQVTPSGQGDPESDNLRIYCCQDTANTCTPTTSNTCNNDQAWASPYTGMACTLTAPSPATDTTYYTRCLVYDGALYSATTQSASYTVTGTGTSSTMDIQGINMEGININ